MDTRKMKLALSAGALALSMALAGCGGGSSPPVSMMEKTPAQMQMEAIMKAISTAEMKVEAISVDNPTQAQIDDADMAIDEVDTAIGAAAAVTQGDLASYTEKAENLESDVARAQSQLDAMTGQAEADRKREDAENKLSAAERQAREEMAKALFPVLALTTNRGSDGTNRPQIDHQEGVPQIHPATIGSERVTLGPVDNSEASLGNWDGMDYSHTASDKATIVARVYNNEADATMKPIGDVYDGTTDENAGIASATNGV